MSRKKKKGGGLRSALIVLIAVLIAATGVMIWMCVRLATAPQDTQAPALQETVAIPTVPPTEATVPETMVPKEPEHVVSTATILSIGDLLMHGQLITDAQQADGSYDFSYIFPYITPYVTAADYAAANLEVTLAGPSRPYQGYPMFNSPDAIVDAAKNAGFDMLLTANNHMYDSGEDGFLRTVRTIREKGLTALGTREEAEEPAYTVQDINGIKVGMVCYTYEQRPENYRSDRVYLNKNILSATCSALVNSFVGTELDPFYTEIGGILEQMRNDGAEATVMFIHWGVEYQLTQNAEQQQIAQKLCDLGFDVIIGGHPHVVQPMALLQSTENPEHKTYCLYSLGNAVSNQRAGISDKFSRYTESGVLLSVTFEKYSDGKVYVAGIDAIPTWVNMHSKNGKREYNILPLVKDKEEQWKTDFELTDNELTAAQDSYAKTMKIIGEGLTACQEDLAQAKTDREAYYQNLAEHPELATQAATQPAATVPETTSETTVAEAA